MYAMVIFTFLLAIVLYGIASASMVYKLLVKNPSAELIPHIATALGFAAHCISLIWLILLHKGMLFLQGSIILLLVSWAVAAGALVLLVVMSDKGESYARYLVPLALLLFVISWGMGVGLSTEVQKRLYLSVPLFVTHVACFVISATCFICSGVSSMLALSAQARLKSADPLSESLGKLPALSTLKNVAHRSMLIGLPIYSFGLMIGILQAHMVNELWFISPRVLSSFLLWLLVVLYLFMVYVVKAPVSQSARIAMIVALCTVCLAVLSSIVPMFALV